MQRLFLTAATAALVMGLAACGSTDEKASDPPQAVASDTGDMARAEGPFAQNEMQMNERMMAAVGTDAGDNWAKKMIEHHQGAIDMSRVMLEQNPSPDVGMMARQTIEKQQKEIEDLRKLLKDGLPDQQSAELYRPAMMDMHQKMMAANGTDMSETFMRKMLEHHRGGVTMSDVALKNGVSGALRQQVQKTRDDQQKEAKMVEAMLAGQSHQQAMQQSGAMPARQVKAEAPPAVKASTPEKASPPVKAQPSSSPKAVPAVEPKTQPKATATCLPEHRAAGHC